MTEQTPEAPPAEAPPAPPSDTDTGKDPAAELAKWKEMARKHEQRAKDNASAAQRLQQLEDEKKSEQQRLEDRATAAERERDAMKADALRYKVAAKHGISGDDVDLLEGIADEDKLTARAQRIAELRAAAAKQAEPAPRQPTPGKPVENLKPGATPKDHQTEEDALYAELFGTGTP